MRYIVIGIMVLLMGTGAWAGEMAVRSVYAVERMSCGACLEKIAHGVASVDRRARVSGDPYKGVVAVDHNADSSSEMLGLAMAEMGYPAREITGQGADMEGVTLLWAGDIPAGSYCDGGRRISCGGSTESWKSLYKKIKETYFP